LDINPAVPSSPFVMTVIGVTGYSSFLGIAPGPRENDLEARAVCRIQAGVLIPLPRLAR
jgi:hypothetical protein